MREWNAGLRGGRRAGSCAHLLSCSPVLLFLFAGCEPAPAAQKQAHPAPRKVLKSSLAGRWYTDDAEKLKAQLDGFLANVKDEPVEGLGALILPHAGYRYSGQTAAHGIKRIAGQTFDRVIVIGPSHSVRMVNMLSVPDATHYATPLGEVPLDTKFLSALLKHPFCTKHPRAHEREHSVQIEVPLLQRALKPFKLVPLVVGRLDPETTRKAARVLRGMIDARTFVVVSSDFTHYGERFGYVPFREDVAENLKKLDTRAFEAIKTGRVDTFRAFIKETDATICGREAIALMMEMLPEKAEFSLLNYDTSGRQLDDYSSSVSYCSIAVRTAWPKGEPVAPPESEELTEEDKQQLLLLARRTLKHRLEKGKAPDAGDLGIKISPAMRLPRSAFVTLHKEGRLRGCIGGLTATQPLYQEVMERVQQSALEDTRFSPVVAAEFPKLHIEISVMTPPRPVASHKEIVIGRHGVILQKHGRRSVYLPQVAPEQGWDVPETLRHLSRKAGLDEDAWKEGATFLVFEANVFSEPEEE